MTSVSETTGTRTCTLRYELRSREIYIEEPITSPELLSEHPQTQEESIRSIQETPNSQFRLVLSVTPCVPRISSLESVNDNTSPLLFSPTSSLTFVPTPCAWRVSYVVGCWNVVAILSMADLVCLDCMQKLCSA